MKNEARVTEFSGEKLYTIGTVSKLTGVGAITLRAWERRYGLIQPIRKESGHRLYSRAHIDQVNRITALTQKGMRISQIRPEMLGADSAADQADSEKADVWKDYLNSMVAAIVSFDEDRLDEIYNEALALYPIGLVTSRLLTPLLVVLGLRWESQQGSIAEEHFFAFYLRNKLGARFHHRPRGSTGPLILLAGLPGEYHEIGLLTFALAAHETGFSACAACAVYARPGRQRPFLSFRSSRSHIYSPDLCATWRAVFPLLYHLKGRCPTVI